jgi:hypothetical protein
MTLCEDSFECESMQAFGNILPEPPSGRCVLLPLAPHGEDSGLCGRVVALLLGCGGGLVVGFAPHPHADRTPARAGDAVWWGFLASPMGQERGYGDGLCQ